MSEDEVRFGYTSCIKRPADKEPMLKSKINMPNSKQPCRCWSQEGAEVPFISDWAGIGIKGKILLSNLWVMGTGNKAEVGE